jgi:hypothetical protein
MVRSMDTSLKGTANPDSQASRLTSLHSEAAHGDARAQYHLGARCHRASVDTLRTDAIESRIEAFKWFQLAAAQEYKDALISCHRVTLAMSRAEFDEGKRRVAAFVVQKQAEPHLP